MPQSVVVVFPLNERFRSLSLTSIKRAYYVALNCTSVKI